MSFLKKYGLPEETIKNMVKDGVIPCLTMHHDEILTFYKKQIDSGLSVGEATHKTCDEMGVSYQWCQRLVRKYL